ncbi:MAG TPA: hypothetical protein VN634_00440 [Candidatus Limnocylindrales bacterium]|nr:hypothetical protein [Candidatus Limnocylindrales bacterium]
MSSNRIRTGLRSADFWYPVFFFAIGILACWKLNPGRAPIQQDDQVYFYISERAASGIAPHISEFDPKNALSMMVNAVFIWFGRHIGADDLMAARTASILAVGFCSALLWICARRIGGTRAMAHMAAVFPLLFVDFLTLAVAGAQPKIFLVLAILVWLYAATTRRPFFLGAAATCCFLVWQPALLMVAISPVAMFAAGERRVANLARVIAGILVPMIFYEAYFWWHGALDEQIYQSLVFAAVHHKSRPNPAWVFRSLFGLGDSNPVRQLGLFVFCFALFAAPVALVAMRRRAWTWLAGRYDRICLILGAYATTGFCFIDYQGYPDRYFVLPFIAIVSAIVAGAVLSWAVGQWSSRIPLRAPAAMPASLAKHAVPIVIVMAMLLAIPFKPYERRSLQDQRKAAAYVGDLLRRHKTVYVVSALHLLAMNRTSNFNYYGFYPVRIRAYLAERVKKEGPLLPLRDGRLPDVLLQSRMEFGPNRRWIERYYRPEKASVLRRQNISMMVLRDDVSPPPATAKAF